MQTSNLKRQETLLNWDMSIVKNRMKKENSEISNEFLDNLETEYKRFQSLRIFFEGEIMPVSPIVDEMWHTHLLFTKDYQNLSKEIGFEFMHHKPIQSEEERAKLTPFYEEKTLKYYEEIYGKPTEEFWTKNCVCGSCATL